MDSFLKLERYASHVALVDDNRELSYGQLVEAADAAVKGLPQRSLVFLECHNSVEAIAAYVGCLRGGHVVHLFGDMDEIRLATLIDSYRPNALIRPATDGESVATLHRQPLPLHPDLRVLLSTSGSTGSPKFVKLSKANLCTNAQAIADYLGLREDDRAITSLKFNYSYGMSVINSHWAAGASLVLTNDSVTTPSFWTKFAECRATSFAGVPYTFESLARATDWAGTDSLRYVTQAGGRLAPELVRQMAALGAKHGWDFFVMYGQTEAAPRIAYLPPDKVATNADCIGRAIPGGELSLVDESGQLITAEKTPGQLRYAGPNVMMGYATQAAELATDDTPDFLLTGDIAVRTAGDFFRVVGRSARIIKPFGVRLNLDELQARARERLADAVCTGTDERVVIATTQSPAPDFAQALAASVNLPHFIFTMLVLDHIPQLPSGKVDYQNLLALTGQGRTVSDDPASIDRSAKVQLLVSGAFTRQFAKEIANIIGLSSGQWNSVDHIFSSLVRNGGVDKASTFTQLAGDSLSYVQTMLALEDYLGRVPDGWENMTVAALEENRGDESAF